MGVRGLFAVFAVRAVSASTAANSLVCPKVAGPSGSTCASSLLQGSSSRIRERVELTEDQEDEDVAEVTAHARPSETALALADREAASRREEGSSKKEGKRAKLAARRGERRWGPNIWARRRRTGNADGQAATFWARRRRISTSAPTPAVPPARGGG
mmetsp:Transcript_96694/g.216611  ORF Transcript_96694/g.216611 Transcript_96694/m.216611 type:complete len:157 (-) Transcript_96694:426-896(-)